MFFCMASLIHGLPAAPPAFLLALSDIERMGSHGPSCPVKSSYIGAANVTKNKETKTSGKPFR